MGKHLACLAVLILAALAGPLPGLTAENASLPAAKPAQAADAVAAWDSIRMPPAPKLASPAVDPATTALLVLDMQPQTCNAERRPRCLETKAAVAALAGRAKAKGMLTVYSIVRQSSPNDIFPEMLHQNGDPVVASTVDKFLNTNLAEILTAKGIKTVIVTGTAAQGAVLHTATAAAQRGMNVVVPVDCVSAEDLFTEAAALWCLAAGPATKDKTTLAESGKISF